MLTNNEYNAEFRCISLSIQVRIGNSSMPGVEKLFLKYGVDIYLNGHDHIYERILPMNDGKIQRGKKGDYIDPNGMVHLTTGSAGCYLNTPPMNPTPPEYNVMLSREFSYTRLRAYNRTHLSLTQIKKSPVSNEFFNFIIP